MSYKLYKNITAVNRTVMNNKTNKYIVIHYTGNKTDTAKNNAAYFKSVNRNASAHYFVDKTTVYQVVEDKDAAWAVGVNYGSNNLFNTVKNNNSISIEMCSDNGAIADATFNNTVELTKSLMDKYHIAASNVYRHYDVCSKLCPGWNGWTGSNVSLWNKFKSAISSASNTDTSSASSTSASATSASATSASSELYRIRKTWADASSQIGAYSSLENAKAACKKGYSVFDSNGNAVYSIANTQAAASSTNPGKYAHKDFIKEVQAAIGANVDGIAGPETLSKTVTVSKTKNSRHAVVKPIQKYFNSLSFDCGDSDGIAGSKFDSATRAFQKANGCIVDGEITQKMTTWKKLLKLS